MGRDEMVPVLPLPLAAFEAIWEWARARQQLAEQHNGAWPEEYKTMMGWIVQWGEDTAVEVLGREPAPVKKPVPKAPRKKKPPPEKPKPRYRLKRR